MLLKNDDVFRFVQDRGKKSWLQETEKKNEKTGRGKEGGRERERERERVKKRRLINSVFSCTIMETRLNFLIPSLATPGVVKRQRLISYTTDKEETCHPKG